VFCQLRLDNPILRPPGSAMRVMCMRESLSVSDVGDDLHQTGIRYPGHVLISTPWDNKDVLQPANQLVAIQTRAENLTRIGLTLSMAVEEGHVVCSVKSFNVIYVV